MTTADIQPATPPALFSPAFQQDPYPTYRRLMDGPRIQSWSAGASYWLVPGFEDCAALLRSPHLSSRRPAYALVGATNFDPAEFAQLLSHMPRWLLLLDAPRHGILRKALNRGFAPMSVDRLKPLMQRIITRLLDDLEKSADPDLVRDFAYPLPVQVICELLGLPGELNQRCVQLTNDIAAWFGTFPRRPDLARVAQAAIAELEIHFTDMIRERGSDPGEDLFGLLLDTARRDEAMTDDDLKAQCVMMLFAGHETTRHLIGNSLWTLMSHPAVLADVQASPALLPNTIEEVLRFESPIQAISRSVTGDIRLDDQIIAAGSSLLFMLGAAQRDPRQFEDPDRFDVRRPHIRHFGFGGDAHVCLGATLARLESRLALAALFERFPHLQPLGERPVWGPMFGFRGLSSLQVQLRH
jgi:cytochrome P450